MQFQNKKSEFNVTSTALNDGETYEGTWVDVSKYSEIRAYTDTYSTEVRMRFSLLDMRML